MTRKLSLTIDGRNFIVQLHKGDLPEGFTASGPLAVDCESLGLSLVRDRLCLVQMTDGQGEIHLVQLDRASYDAPRLKALLGDPAREKIFHFARFDIAILQRDLGVLAAPVFCTKIASKLARTYTDRHGLKDVVKELVGKEVSKDQQSSDWGAAELTDAQLAYAAADVIHLHAIRDRLASMLQREGRLALAEAAFAFLPARAALDLAGWDEIDIFAHS
jgi:ribonuclease D